MISRLAVILVLVAACGEEDECVFGPIDIVPFTGAPVTTTDFDCSPDHWMCGAEGPGALVFVSDGPCERGEDELVIHFLHTTESPLFTRVEVGLDAAGTVIRAGAQTGRFEDGCDATPAAGGAIAIEGDGPVLARDCVRGWLRLVFEDATIEGPFQTQECTY